jgi:hypothetical protein
MKKFYVIAGNYNQFVDWCAQNRVSHSSPLVSFVTGPECLRGLHNPEIVVTGTYRERKDFHELNMIVRDVCRPPEPQIVYVEVPAKPKPVVLLSMMSGRLVNWQ